MNPAGGEQAAAPLLADLGEARVVDTSDGRVVAVRLAHDDVEVHLLPGEAQRVAGVLAWLAARCEP